MTGTERLNTTLSRGLWRMVWFAGQGRRAWSWLRIEKGHHSGVFVNMMPGWHGSCRESCIHCDKDTERERERDRDRDRDRDREKETERERERDLFANP